MACSGRGNGEQQRQNSKNVVRNVADCNSSQSSLCPGRDGAHDANMNNDWSKESADIILISGIQHLQQIFNN